MAYVRPISEVRLRSSLNGMLKSYNSRITDAHCKHIFYLDNFHSHIPFIRFAGVLYDPRRRGVIVYTDERNVHEWITQHSDNILTHAQNKKIKVYNATTNAMGARGRPTLQIQEENRVKQYDIWKKFLAEQSETGVSQNAFAASIGCSGAYMTKIKNRVKRNDFVDLETEV